MFKFSKRKNFHFKQERGAEKKVPGISGKIKRSCFFLFFFTGLYFAFPGRERAKQAVKYRFYKWLFSGPVSEIWGNFIFYPSIFTGNYVYAGRDLKMAVFDVRHPQKIKLVQTLPQYGMLRMCYLEGRHIYCVVSHMGLSIFRILSSGRLKQISHFVLPGYASSLAKIGSYLYIAARGEGLHVVDIKRKNSPRLIRTLKLGWVNFVLREKRRLYVTVAQRGVVILKLKHLEHPQLLGELQITYPLSVPPLDPLPHEMAFYKNILYVGNGPRGLAMIDVSSPRHPVLKGYFRTGDFISNVASFGSILMVGGPPQLKLYLDVSDPLRPKKIPGLPFAPHNPNLGFFKGRAILGYDRYGFALLSLKEPEKPQVLGEYRVAPVARRIALSRHLLAVGVCSGGVELYDVTKPGQPQPLSRFDTRGCVHGVSFKGDYLYVADGLFGVHVLDIRNPAQPHLLNVFFFERHPWGILVEKNIAYLASGSKGLALFDLTFPGKEKFLSTHEGAGDYSMNIYKLHHLVFLSGLFGGFHVFHVAQPRKPELLPPPVMQGFASRLKQKIGYRVMDVIAFRSFLYAASYKSGLEIFTLAHPRRIAFVRRQRTGGYAYGLALYRHKLYLANYEKGIQVWDLSVPSRPRFLKQYRTSGHPHHLVVRGDFAYVADGDRGLAVLDLKTGKVSYPPPPQVFHPSPF